MENCFYHCYKYQIYDICNVNNTSLNVSPLCSAQPIQAYVTEVVMSIILSRVIHVLEYSYVQREGSSLSETKDFITVIITVASLQIISEFTQRRCHSRTLSLSSLRILRW